MILILNYNNYLKNPIADFCVSQLPSPTILTWEDIKADVKNLHHPTDVMNNLKSGKTRPSFLGDELRLYYSLQNDNFLYCDADVYLPSDVQKAIWASKNCVAYDPYDNQINNGTFFCSDKNCKFNEFYFNIYETSDLVDVTNTNVYRKFPYHVDFDKKVAGDMNLLSVPYRHFALSKIDDFKAVVGTNIDTVYYTKESDVYNILKKEPKYIWKMVDPRKNNTAYLLTTKKTIFIWDTVYEYINQDDMIRLWKEQLNYSFGKTLKFVEC
jgi:hypothetical protein